MASPWSRDRTLARLRERAMPNQELRAPIIKHDEPALHAAAVAHFGTFANAVRAAGIPARPRRVLSRATLIADLRALDERGVRMTANDVVDAGRNDLIGSTRRYFGGFIAARKAAGIAAPPRRKREVRWGREVVLAMIQRAARRGEPLAHSRADREMFRAALNSFNTWREAVEAAGIDYDAVSLRPHEYSDEDLLEILRDIHRRHPAMTLSELHLFPPHGNSLRQRFGDLRAAARRAGIRGWPRRGKPAPAPRGVTLQRLRARARAGKSYATNALAAEEPRILQGAKHHFGSLSGAVRAAGISPMRGARRERLLDELFEVIRRRDTLGRSLLRVDVLHDTPLIVRRSDFYFGSWRRAVRVALARRPVRTSDFGGPFAQRLHAYAQRVRSITRRSFVPPRPAGDKV